MKLKRNKQKHFQLLILKTGNNLLMSKLNNILFFFLFLTFHLYHHNQVLAQKGKEIEFKASAPGVVTQGKAFNYTIIGNENIRGSVQIPDTEGIRVVTGPSTFISTQSSYINGKMENVTSVTFSYNLIASKEGILTIPPAIINAGKKTYKTNPVEISVIAGEPPPQKREHNAQENTGDEKAEEDYFVRLSPSKRSVFIGEELLMEAGIFTNQRLQLSEIKYPEFEGFWKQDLEPDEQASREIIGNKEYLTQVIKRELLIPQKTGKILIKPLEITALVQKRVRTQRRSPFGDIFDDPFFNSFENIPVVLTSPAVSINVKPLPPGAPEGFNGAVGNFTIEISTDREIVKTNDAITMRLIIKGKGNLSLLGAPQIALPHDVESFEPKIQRNLKHSAEGTIGTISFEYIIIPRHPGKFRIPPVVFSFFNPDTKTYQQLKTREILFEAETTSDSTKNSISGDETVIQGIRREKVESIGNDILFIKTSNPVFRKTGRYLTDSLPFRLAFPVGIIFYILLVIIYRNRIKRYSDLAYIRTRKAWKKAEKRLNTAKKMKGLDDKKIYEEIHFVIWEYLIDKLNIPRAELSRKRIEEELFESEIPPEIRSELWELIDECEMAGYAAVSQTEPTVLLSRSRDILYEIEQLK